MKFEENRLTQILNKSLNNDKFVEAGLIPAAKQIIGAKLVREIGGRTITGRIVEVECYHQSDPASHTFNGPTGRNAVMFGPAGFAYVYFTYGMHYCFNIVVGPEGEGAGVLVRALEPVEGLEIMRDNRGKTNPVELCSGPAKLCQALNITRDLNGHDLTQAPLQLDLNSTPVKNEDIVTTTRVGILKAIDKPWRFYIKDSPFVSKK